MNLKKYRTKSGSVEAVEITPAFIVSLETAGQQLQKLGGEQVEIMHPGPQHKRSFGQIGEFLVSLINVAGQQDYVLVPASAFKALFVDADEEPVEAEAVAEPETDLLPASPEAAPAAELATEPEEEKPLSAAEKKRLAKEARLKELGDVGSLEKPLAEGVDPLDETPM